MSKETTTDAKINTTEEQKDLAEAITDLEEYMMVEIGLAQDKDNMHRYDHKFTTGLMEQLAYITIIRSSITSNKQ